MYSKKTISILIISAGLMNLMMFASQTSARENGKIAFVSNRDGNDEIYVMNSDGNNQFAAAQFRTNGDIPAQGDYDGDGRADLAVFRGGTWWILQSANGQARVNQFGLANDKPVPSASNQ